MILMLALGAALGAQADPPAARAPPARFVICPGHVRCPPRPTRQDGGALYPGMLVGIIGVQSAITNPRPENEQRPQPPPRTPGMLRFGHGRATLSPEARRRLDRVAARMREAGNWEALLEGHADSRGSAAANVVLAGQRAAAAADYLAAQGVPADRILAISWGETGAADAVATRSVLVTLRTRPEPAAP